MNPTFRYNNIIYCLQLNCHISSDTRNSSNGSKQAALTVWLHRWTALPPESCPQLTCSGHRTAMWILYFQLSSIVPDFLVSELLQHLAQWLSLWCKVSPRGWKASFPSSLSGPGARVSSRGKEDRKVPCLSSWEAILGSGTMRPAEAHPFHKPNPSWVRNNNKGNKELSDLCWHSSRDGTTACPEDNCALRQLEHSQWPAKSAL